MRDPLVNLIDVLEREAKGIDRPLPLPWPTLNSGLGGGLRPGTFNLLVGEPGSAKTYIGLAACLHAERNGWRWAYWPFERDDAYAARRLLGILTDSWDVLDSATAGEAIKLMNAPENFDLMAKMTQSIQTNPRQMRVDSEGEIYVQRCEYRGILNMLRLLCESRDLVVLDPLSMLSFDDDGGDAWKGQEIFAKDAAAIAAQTRSRLLVVHHTRKAAPGGKPRQSSLDEVAGSAALSRFADNLIFLEHSPDEIESEIIPLHGIKTLQVHKRTLFIAKARDGKGTGWRIACDLGTCGPVLVEHGFIRRKAH